MRNVSGIASARRSTRDTPRRLAADRIPPRGVKVTRGTLSDRRNYTRDHLARLRNNEVPLDDRSPRPVTNRAAS